MAEEEARRREVESELDGLMGQVRGGGLRAKDKRRVFARIRSLEVELAAMGGPSPREGVLRDYPKVVRTRWWWLDPGQGAPKLTTLLLAAVMALVLFVSLSRKCSHTGPHGANKPSVQHSLDGRGPQPRALDLPPQRPK